CMQNVEYPYSF
nr:immunoglobulin light chain junction region [Macaca mulatta]